MNNLGIQIIWSADARHYILENGLDHEACTIIALHLPKNIDKSTQVLNELVDKWFNPLEPKEKLLVTTIHLN